MPEEAEPPRVLLRTEGRLGHITLNRPRQINALDLSMVDAVMGALTGWAVDPDVDVVLLDGAGERGLCAGGDIRTLYDGMVGDALPPGLFWSREYEMNAFIAHFPKPLVTLMDGIVFGGGVGIAGHAGIRIVTERSQVAMPETAIGLCPDVGSLYLLSRSPGQLGTHLALTGSRVAAAQAIHAGLADHELPSEVLPDLIAELRTGVLPRFPAATPTDHPAWIDECYRFDRVTDILHALAGRAEPEAQQTLSTLQAMSPTALVVTLAAIRRAATLTLEQVLDQDLRVCSRFLHHPDLREGIRARIIDKDRRPRWQPATLAEVEPAVVAEFFAPAG